MSKSFSVRSSRVVPAGLVLGAAILLGACAMFGANSVAANLVGSEWVVEDIGGAGIVDSSKVSLNFTDDSQISGRASCNGYGGAYSADNGALQVSRLISTKRMCPPALMNQEQRFMQLLTDAVHYEFDSNGALLIKTATGETILARSASVSE